MDMSRRFLTASVVTLLLLVAAGCGQKPGVALPPGTEIVGNKVVDAETGEVLGTVEELLGPGVAEAGDPGTGGAGVAGGIAIAGTSGRTGTAVEQQGTDGGGEAAPPGSGGDTTGITADTIKIGIHAPLTGAAPVPSDSVEKGKDLYYRWMAANGEKLLGREVEVVLKNDQYNPSTAVSVCKEMVEKDHVFLLTGITGTDQIQACARYAASVGVPYLATGVTELVLNSLSNHFATSMTYKEQGPLLADLLASKLGGKAEKNGMLTFDTPNFEDARQGFRDGMQRHGARIDYERTVSKGAGTNEARTVVQEMNSRGIENVYVLTSPVWWLNVLKQADTQGFHPQWIGVGISMTFDTISSVACGGGNSIDGAKFLSPFPAWSDRDRFDADFAEAVARFHPEKRGGDDFMWLLWSHTKMIWNMFDRIGPQVSRESFIYSLERTRNLENGIGPRLNYAPDDHFGASEVHLSEARCSDGRWHTTKSFVSDF